jgi:cytochrome c biogenesis protein CcmG, thiol:disulfide interchange protein DsbE
VQAPAETSTGRLPPKLASNVEQADRIVGEGREAFEKRLRALSGHPVVVNQWASWCTSCRFEFPFFAEAVKRHRARVAFLGLDSQDERGSAEAFLEEFPVGFPSIFDPDAEVAAAYGGGRAWPTTMFFDAEGELVNVNIGAYATAELLEQDIRRWALDQGG